MNDQLKILKNIKILVKFFRHSSLKVKDNKMVHIVNCKDPDAIRLATESLRRNKIIAIPTDTIYGLACNANSPEAINKLYKLKGRDELKPVAICVSSLDDVRHWGHAEHLPDELLKKLLPGPVTVILERTVNLDNPFLNPHTTKIGIRIPDYEFIQDVAKFANIPVALTSANLSNEPSSLSVNEFECLYPKLSLVFDGGKLGEGVEGERAGSTVVDLSKVGHYSVVRRGVALKRTAAVMEHFNIVKDDLF